MQFELNQALIDEILFFMEDQHGEFLLDTQERIVLSVDDEDFDKFEFEADESRYIALPEWEPNDGFRLMEHFTASLHNALVREELSAALNRGRGVFRAFKDALAPYPDIEKLWYNHKDREMKKEVITWYNGLRVSWGLELIGEEPEDIDNLAMEDFHVRQGTEQDKDTAEKLHQICLDELNAKLITEFGPHFGAKFSSNSGHFYGMGEWAFPGDLCFVAEAAAGEFAGYISAVRSDATIRICAIEVAEEYRGLGLGKTLMSRFLEQADNEKIPHVIVDLPAGQEYFSRALLREDFEPCIQRYFR